MTLTIGTAGHVDHGKTALVAALTGVDTDRLPEEAARGMSIVLGFAPLRLPGGRRLSLVDVPGHERLVRVMVSGATGIDGFLLAVAADDGVMPQTVEHLRVLEALGIAEGVIAVTRSDLAAPATAVAAARALVPGAEVIACSARTGAGIGAVAAALARLAARLPTRPAEAAPPRLHIDRVFTVRGAGTVVTGTLWSGTIAPGDRLHLQPAGREVRVRGVEVHGEPADRAVAGQRAALNLAGIHRDELSRGDVLAIAPVGPVHRLDLTLRLAEPLPDRTRVQIHHGTRDTGARLRRLDAERWRAQTERPLMALPGDRVVIRRIGPPGTVGGGVVGSVGGLAGPPTSKAGPAGSIALPPRPDTVARRLRDAGSPPLEVLVAVVEAIVAAEGSVTLPRLRDELGTSRRQALVILNALDDARITRRLPGDRRVLRSGETPAFERFPD